MDVLQVDFSSKDTLSDALQCDTRLQARWMLLMLSQYRRTGSLMGTPRSFYICFSKRASHVETTADFVLDNATIGYFLLLHDMALLIKGKTKPDVNRLLAL